MAWVSIILNALTAIFIVDRVISEMPDVMNASQVEILRSWNGELRFLQNMKLRRISKKSLVG